MLFCEGGWGDGCVLTGWRQQRFAGCLGLGGVEWATALRWLLGDGVNGGMSGWSCGQRRFAGCLEWGGWSLWVNDLGSQAVHAPKRAFRGCRAGALYK